jgi:RNA polymerase sigma-70 factor (ECF subfamily)
LFVCGRNEAHVSQADSTVARVTTGGSSSLVSSATVAAPDAAQSDDALVARVRQHDERAFEMLMRRYNRRLFRIARSILRNEDAAEDAVQEAYIRAYGSLDRYEPTGRFGAWIARVVINEALMLRRGARADTLSLDALDELAWAHSASLSRGPANLDPLDNVQARQLLELAIDALPEAFRTVFVLRVVEQLSVTETADYLALNESTVKTRMHRAQRALHLHLSRRLRRERLSVFEFGGTRCDRIVSRVLTRCRMRLCHPP